MVEEIWRVWLLCRKGKSGLERSWNVAEKGEAVRDAGSSEGVEEAEEGNERVVEGDGKSFERGEELVRTDLNEAEEEVDTGGKETAPDDIVG